MAIAKAKPQLDLNSLAAQGRKVFLVNEVALMLGATDQHVLNLIESGQLGAINIGNGSRKFWRIPLSECRAFMDERRA